MNDHASRTVPPLVFQNQKYSHNIIIVWKKQSKKPLNKSPAHTQTRTHIISFIHLLGRSNSVAPYTRHTTHTHKVNERRCARVCAIHIPIIYAFIYWITTNTHTHTSSTTPCKRPYVCLVGAAAIHFYML